MFLNIFPLQGKLINVINIYVIDLRFYDNKQSVTQNNRLRKKK